MKKGWKVLIVILIIGAVIESLTVLGLCYLVRGLQADRNRLNTITANHERLWSKQATFNREYYFKNRNPERADKEWPLAKR